MLKVNVDDKNATYSPIAIVGIGCRFPGGIESPQTFWDFMRDGRDGTREVPSDRWSIEKFYRSDPDEIGKTYTCRGGFLDDISGFDPQFFGVSPREAAYMDPQQRLLLEVTWEAFEDAAIPPGSWADRKVGVYVGLFTHDYENLHMRVSEQALYGPHSATGMSTTIAANRLSHVFNFTGPSMVVDTACSSSLVAVHLACRGLQNGEAEFAVAGGVNVVLNPEMTVALSKASMLSPDGLCKSFDARANGYARSDGAGMVVLKRLSDALADGDDIYSVIRGSAVNQDGRSKGITVPSGTAQQIVMRDALANAGARPGDITYVEAHGTGTPVGDPIEAGALGTVLTEGQPERTECVVGSVKSNFGHTESAAGVAGLIKVALMQRHDRIPPNIHFETPNPNIPFDELRLRVPTRLEDWPLNADGQRLAGINSFGFGGTNAHVIVGAAPPPERATADANPDDQRRRILCLSAGSDEALQAAAGQYAGFLQSDVAARNTLGDIAAAMAFGREHHPFRLAVSAQNREDAAGLLEAYCKGFRPPGLVIGKTGIEMSPGLAFVFSGMGQQWWAMGRGLLRSESVFAAKIAELEAVFTDLGADWRLGEILDFSEESSRIDQTEFAQPAIFSLQIALSALWESIGVRPDVVVGHSIGEVAAACAAGALTLEDAASVCLHRSRLQATLSGRGGMMAVGLSESEAQSRIRHLADTICIAAVNSPISVTLAGETDSLEKLAGALEGDSIFARQLNVEVPYHSPVMDEIGQEFTESLAHIKPRAGKTELISSVTGRQVDGESLDASYWKRNIREPVAFASAMASVISRRSEIIVEIGAHPVLSTSIGECLDAAGQQGKSITSLRRNQDDALTFQSAVGQLHCRGFPLEFTGLFKKPKARICLPINPWQRSHYWTETDESRRHRTGSDDGKPVHPLLGTSQRSPNPSWCSQIRHDRPAYLSDHRVQGAVVFPAAGFAEMALAAAAELFGAGGAIAVEKLTIASPLVLADKVPAELQFSVHHSNQFEIHGQVGHSEARHWTRHAAGGLASAERAHVGSDLDLAAIQDRIPEVRGKADIYRHFNGLGLEYGSQFQNLETVWIGQDEALGKTSAAPELQSEAGRYVLHPAVLDACFQLLAAVPATGTFLPVGIDRLEVYEPGISVAWAHGRLVSKSGARIVADITLTDQEGRIFANVSGLTCQLFEDSRRNNEVASGSSIYDRLWLARPMVRERPEIRAAEHLSSPQNIAPVVQERHRDRIAANGHLGYCSQVFPELDALAIGYFFDALNALGWEWNTGQRFTADQMVKELGISLRHHRFLQCMNQHLLDAGYLVSDGAGLRLKKAPPSKPAREEWNSFVLAHPGGHAEGMLVRKFGSHLAQYLRDEEEPLSALFSIGSSVAEHFYADSPICRPYNQIVSDVVLEILQALPEGESLRVLEVGTGTGGLTSYLLPLLPPTRAEYVLTDVSDRFLKQARDRFRAFPFVHYEIFDVEQGSDAPVFSPNSFDLIVISGTAHATTDLRATLGNLRDLLAPGGLLALSEVTTRRPWIDLVLGLQPGWWVFGDTDLRPDHATLSSAGWLSVLRSCGFDDCAGVTDGFDGDASLQSVVLAKKPIQEEFRQQIPEEVLVNEAEPKQIILLADKAGFCEPLARELKAHDRSVTIIEAGEPDWDHGLGQLQNVLAGDSGQSTSAPAIVDLRALFVKSDGPLAEDTGHADISGLACLRLQHLARVLSDRSWEGEPKLWVVTNGAETVGGVFDINLEQSAIRGFTRVLMTEAPVLNASLVDLGPRPLKPEIVAFCREILAESPEDEIALRGDRRFVSRVAEHRNLRQSDGRKTSYSLSRVSPIPPSDLVFQESVLSPPGPGQVQVCVCAAGLNFKDFATLSGLVDIGTSLLGLEGAGIVTSVGEGVDDLAIGDPVMGPMDNSLSSPINTSAKLLVRIPPNLSFVEAAGIPVAFLSAYHALGKQAHLGKGETVLIHTAASGLGLAAIQVARALGATVLATAGNEEKRAYLRDLDIDYVGDSRSGRFADEVMQHTQGRGVDVVLNTLPAAMNEKNIDVLRPATGRLIDVSNIHYQAQLDYGALKKGISVSAFDLHLLADGNPGHINRLQRELATLFERGDLRPIPYRVTPLARIAESVDGFKRASHIGKVIVSLTDSIVDIQPRRDDLVLSDDGCYLVTGGLTGFGLATSKWLVSKGAKSLVLAGRRGADTPGAQAEIEKMRAAGADVLAVSCDVGDRRQVRDLIARLGSELPPLRGVVHAAMVLRDCPINELTGEQIREVLVPKIDGAWNLHLETLDKPLDFFVCYSSASNLIGNRNQANYAAANEYLEALARYRNAKKLPAVAIGWGAIGSSGAVARDERIRSFMSRQGILDLDEEKIWAALSQGLNGSKPYICAMVVDWPKAREFSTTVARSPRFSLVAGGEAYGADGESRAVRQSALVDGSTPEERRESLKGILINEVSGVLGMDPVNLEIDQPLENLGFDSLMAAELMVAVEKATGHTLQRMALLRADLTTSDLIDEIADGLIGEIPVARTDTQEINETSESAKVDIRVEDLSDSEVDELLKELAAGE